VYASENSAAYLFSCGRWRPTVVNYFRKVIMKSNWRWVLAVCVLATLCAGVARVGIAQVPQITYMTGQNIVPVYEGWQQKSDGTFDMIFGYMNRNYQQELSVPIGPDNTFDPGGTDRGQPTFFYARRHEFQFRVNVPKDWGAKELTWTLTANGVTEKAYGSLKPVWEIDLLTEIMNTGASARNLVAGRNAPPSLVVEPSTVSVVVPAAATLNAVVSDDGLPPPRPERRGRGSENTEPLFLNAPLPREPGPPASLSLSWIVFRGPKTVAFEPAGWVPVKSAQKSVTTARFTEPGTYVLRALAHDGMVQTVRDVTVNVDGAATQRD
jgi:hypothetical protein